MKVAAYLSDISIFNLVTLVMFEMFVNLAAVMTLGIRNFIFVMSNIGVLNGLSNEDQNPH